MGPIERGPIERGRMKRGHVVIAPHILANSGASLRVIVICTFNPPPGDARCIYLDAINIKREKTILVMWKEATAAMPALNYSGLHTRIYRGYVQVY